MSAPHALAYLHETCRKLLSLHWAGATTGPYKNHNFWSLETKIAIGTGRLVARISTHDQAQHGYTFTTMLEVDEVQVYLGHPSDTPKMKALYAKRDNLIAALDRGQSSKQLTRIKRTITKSLEYQFGDADVIRGGAYEQAFRRHLTGDFIPIIYRILRVLDQQVMLTAFFGSWADVASAKLADQKVTEENGMIISLIKSPPVHFEIGHALVRAYTSSKLDNPPKPFKASLSVPHNCGPKDIDRALKLHTAITSTTPADLEEALKERIVIAPPPQQLEGVIVDIALA